jgi:acetoin utilization deacetylase AcuC-like enzyme
MILYDPTIPVSLVEFGILIPIQDSRAVKTYENLKNHPKLGPNLKRWHIDRIEETITREDLLRVHTPAYVEQLYGPQLETAIISTYELIDPEGNYYRYDPGRAVRPLTALMARILKKAAGTVQCARIALTRGFCYYFSGGMHHAHADHGSGFCLINDIVIAARILQAETSARRVWIIDTDAHKGDGTAAISAEDPTPDDT